MSLSNHPSRDSRSALGRGKKEEGAVYKMPFECPLGIWLSSIRVKLQHFIKALSLQNTQRLLMIRYN